jgi:hypothetical protein
MLIGCSSQNKNVNNPVNTKPDKLNVANKENSENKILFLTLRMTLSDSTRDIYQFTVINSLFKDGTLNTNSFQHDGSIEPYHLYCEITDDNKKRTDLIKVQNPLLKVVEYSPDKERLEKKVLVSNTGEIYLRFQFSKSSRYLTIYKPQPDLRTLKKIYYAQI